MPSEPVPQQPRRDKHPRSAAAWPDWMDDPAYLALRAADEDLDDPDLDQDPDEASPPPDTDYRDASDDELAGAIAARDRSEACISARKHAAVAELIRRPGPGCQPHGPARMPEGMDEFAAKELAAVLGETSPSPSPRPPSPIERTGPETWPGSGPWTRISKQVQRAVTSS